MCGGRGGGLLLAITTPSGDIPPWIRIMQTARITRNRKNTTPMATLRCQTISSSSLYLKYFNLWSGDDGKHWLCGRTFTDYVTINCSAFITDRQPFNQLSGLTFVIVNKKYWINNWKHVEIECQLDATEVFITDLIACSTCFGHHYAHHQELRSIIQWLLSVVFCAVVFK